MKINKNLIIGIIIGGILFGGVGVAAAIFSAKDISFTPTDKTWEVSNVQEAMDSLYEQTSSNSNEIKMTLQTDPGASVSSKPSSSSSKLTFVMPYTGKFTVKYGNVVNYSATSTSVTADGTSLGTFPTVNTVYTFSAEKGQTIVCTQSGAWYSGNQHWGGSITVQLDSTLQ